LLAPVSDVAVRAGASPVRGVAVGAVRACALVGAVDAESAVGTGVHACGASESRRTDALTGDGVALADLSARAVLAAAQSEFANGTRG
jgi:hypothetical protein